LNDTNNLAIGARQKLPNGLKIRKVHEQDYPQNGCPRKAGLTLLLLESPIEKLLQITFQLM
jgi:hypothetical protein